MSTPVRPMVKMSSRSPVDPGVICFLLRDLCSGSPPTVRGPAHGGVVDGQQHDHALRAVAASTYVQTFGHGNVWLSGTFVNKAALSSDLRSTDLQEKHASAAADRRRSLLAGPALPPDRPVDRGIDHRWDPPAREHARERGGARGPTWGVTTHGAPGSAGARRSRPAGAAPGSGHAGRSLADPSSGRPHEPPRRPGEVRSETRDHPPRVPGL